MATFKIEGVTHWSIPVNNLKDSEDFYGGLLGLKPLGRLNNNVMSCFNVGDHNILLCEREKPQDKTIVEDRVHHSSRSVPKGSCRLARRFTKRRFPSSSWNTAPRVISPGGSFIFTIPAAIVSRSATQVGKKECRKRPMKRS